MVEIHPWRDRGVNPSYGIARSHASPDETPGQYHEGKANCAYGDGHVSRLRPDGIVANLKPPEEEEHE